MPYTTELTEDYLGIIHVGSGTVCGPEILQGCQSVAALVQNTENFHYKLVDFSAATELQISTQEFEEIVAMDRVIAAARPHITVAIVAPNDQIEALAQHWEDLIEELCWSTMVVRTRSAALQWLRNRFITAQMEF